MRDKIAQFEALKEAKDKDQLEEAAKRRFGYKGPIVSVSPERRRKTVEEREEVTSRPSTAEGTEEIGFAETLNAGTKGEPTHKDEKKREEEIVGSEMVLSQEEHRETVSNSHLLLTIFSRLTRFRRC